MQPLIFLSLWAIYNSRFHKPWGKNDKAIITNVKLAITHPQNILCIAKLDNPICPFWTENKKKIFFTCINSPNNPLHWDLWYLSLKMINKRCWQCVGCDCKHLEWPKDGKHFICKGPFIELWRTARGLPWEVFQKQIWWPWSSSLLASVYLTCEVRWLGQCIYDRQSCGYRGSNKACTLPVLVDLFAAKGSPSKRGSCHWLGCWGSLG